MTRLEQTLYRQDLDSILTRALPWDALAGKRILLTGASGLLGTMLTDALLAANDQKGLGLFLTAQGRSEQAARARFGVYWDRPDFRFLCQDVCAPYAQAERFDCILHAASNTHPRLYASDPIGTIEAGILGTKQLLELAARTPGCRLLLVSSVEIYGENDLEHDAFTETDMGYLDCNTLRAGYCEGKRAAESLCQAYIAARNVDAVIVRLCRCYGPTLREDDSKAMSQFLHNALAGRDIVLKSEGTQRYSYLYAADAAAALLTVLLLGETGQAYNAADEKSDVTLRDLAACLAGLAGTKVVFDLPDVQEALGYSKATLALLNPAKLQALGYSAAFSLRQGLERTLKMMKG